MARRWDIAWPSRRKRDVCTCRAVAPGSGRVERGRPGKRSQRVGRRYRAKRDFARTPEPVPGRDAERSTPRFVVQKHHARKLHWDFRLEHDGVLWSWAVPKGPSLDPADKRLAVRVEDHPLDYASFHGTIPHGNYGAGTVEIWDEGTWAPLGDPADDPADGLRGGEIKFRLAGTRLHGAFVLVRMRPRGGRPEHADNWLLIKEHDAEERAGADAEALEATPAPKPPRLAAPGMAHRPHPRRPSVQGCRTGRTSKLALRAWRGDPSPSPFHRCRRWATDLRANPPRKPPRHRSGR